MRKGLDVSVLHFCLEIAWLWQVRVQNHNYYILVQMIDMACWTPRAAFGEYVMSKCK